ncbi:thioredoxin family protein [Helcococcus kunzii]|uniref:Redox-active disulfide protein 2 n=1 Tax=Helcococcus kunzii ATCC 51366 TaxID=883114 RepID=H3NQ26_9FIRM|nr:thioredoxin family protein [Helcococcus kunzii]EHR32706.1 redox-active disulfide protein 2 [Helcococcus kunzii ATCC 51366]MCT1797038.1 thioredoxin family protein [Helcococcus kunzii]MCT1989741.1 thioredoxin family protein [Helcococcus kunzii]QUY65327.1 thioredoxin family protein [Helcococcus kunzii]QZO75984.1 TM0996/MTH895 family glutaredoxin-like protein [Helcococcus kunzii]
MNRVYKVLGSGCAKCQKLEENLKEALSQNGENAEVEHVTDFAEIARYGVMSTPALVVDENVVSMGKVLTVDEIKNII